MPDQTWLEEAAKQVDADKKTHIPYLIYSAEDINQQNNLGANEILSHLETKEIIKELIENSPTTSEHTTIITPNYEIHPSRIEEDFYFFDDQKSIIGFYVDLTPENSKHKIRLYKPSEANRKPRLELTTKTDCTSPEGAVLTKTEFFDTDGHKMSDHFRLQFDKSPIDRDDATDQLSSEFYLRIVSSLENTVPNYPHPRGYLVEIGFTSEQNGDAPMILFQSDPTDPNKLTTKPQDMSSSVTDHPELLAKYIEIVTIYSSQILGRQLAIS